MQFKEIGNLWLIALIAAINQTGPRKKDFSRGSKWMDWFSNMTRFALVNLNEGNGKRERLIATNPSWFLVIWIFIKVFILVYDSLDWRSAGYGWQCWWFILDWHLIEVLWRSSQNSPNFYLIWFDLIFFCIHISLQFFDNNNIKYNISLTMNHKLSKYLYKLLFSTNEMINCHKY